MSFIYNNFWALLALNMLTIFTSKSFTKIVGNILIILTTLLLVGCEEQSTTSKDKLYTVNMRGQNLYIPYDYVRFKNTFFLDDSGSLQTFYPGSTPVPGDPVELWREGEWWKNVRISLTFSDKWKSS